MRTPQPGPVLAAFSAAACSAPSRRTKARRSWERDSSRAGSASPSRPPEPVEQGAEAVDGQAGLEEHGRGLGEVDGGQLEEAVAVVGHHDLGRRVGQLGPHGVDLGLGRGLLLGQRRLRRRLRDVGVARRPWSADAAASPPSFLGKCSPDGVHRLLMLVLYAP